MDNESKKLIFFIFMSKKFLNDFEKVYVQFFHEVNHFWANFIIKMQLYQHNHSTFDDYYVQGTVNTKFYLAQLWP